MPSDLPHAFVRVPRVMYTSPGSAGARHQGIGKPLAVTNSGRLPDVLVGGAPRSGTSWLHTLFARHPQVYVPVPFKPEPKFFLVDGEYAKGLSYYSERWFAGVPAHVVACEKSANYLESPTAAQRISRDLPGVRMIFILREPASRALSNYLWSRMNGLETESFQKAIELEPERERNYPDEFRFSRPYSYFSRGLYAMHLQHYFDLLGRDRILVMRYEDIADAPQQFAKRVLTFLDVELGSLDADALGMINSTDEPNDTDEFRATVGELTERYRRPNAELYRLLGSDFEGWDI